MPGLPLTTARLWVELHGKKGLGLVHDALVAVVIRVGEERFPVGRQRGLVHSEAVVLGRDVAAGRAHVDARLVHTAVAKLHLVRLGTCCQR